MSLNATKRVLKQSKICLKKYLGNRQKTQIKRNWSDDDINDEVDDLKPIQLKKVADEYDNNVKEREQKILMPKKLL